MDNKKVDFHFRTVNPADFELVYVMSAKKKIFSLMFNHSKASLKEKKGIEFNERDIKEFEIPKCYHKYIQTAMGKTVRDTERQLKKNKMLLTMVKMSSCKFTKNDDEDVWDITLVYTGTYIDKR